MLFGILKRSCDKFEPNPLTAQPLGHFCVPNRHPAKPVGFELQITDLPILLDLKPAFGHLGSVVHSGLGLKMPWSFPWTQVRETKRRMTGRRELGKACSPMVAVGREPCLWTAIPCSHAAWPGVIAGRLLKRLSKQQPSFNPKIKSGIDCS